MAVQPIVARSTTSREIWETFHRTYGKPTRGHVKQIKQQLKQISKGNNTINDYMRSIIDKSDQLALLCAPYDHEDLLDIITDGLGEDYRAITEMVNGRDTPISIDELHEKLINRENTLKVSSPKESVVPVTANVTQTRPQHNFSTSQGGSSNRGGFRPQRPYLGKCQLWGFKDMVPEDVHTISRNHQDNNMDQSRTLHHVLHNNGQLLTYLYPLLNGKLITQQHHLRILTSLNGFLTAVLHITLQVT